MSGTGIAHPPPPEAPKGTLPYGASPVTNHPEAPPGCVPSPINVNTQNAVQGSTAPASNQYNPADYPPPPLPPTHGPSYYTGQPSATGNYPPPPQHMGQSEIATDDPSDPAHYMRNPSKLTAYIIPFPTPRINVPTGDIPRRFMIYTPPPPPLQPWDPNSGTKEPKMYKVQRKWQNEVRSAKTSTAKTASWKGVKSKATKGINWAMNQTTSSNLEFLGRVSPTNANSDSDTDSPDGKTTKKTVPVDEMILVYPTTMHMAPDAMREEFVNTMLRTKSKAQRDAVIATGLLPVAFGIDVMLTLVWPFGGLAEIDGLWGWSSFRGAKTARSVTKRLSSASNSTNPHDDHAKDNQLKLTFLESQRIELLTRYLEAECHKVDQDVFPGFHTAPTESQVLEAIGWAPEHTGGETKNWEDEEWERSEVKEDVKNTFKKAAKEWKKWALLLEKNPEKALSK